MGRAKPELQAEAIRLRVEERLSLRQIAGIVGVSKGSLSAWLKPYPLTEEERKGRNNITGLLQTPKKDRGQASKFHRAIVGRNLTRQQKGKIAESAVLFRLALHGFNAFGSMFDGDKPDWLVEVPETGKTYRIQVRWVKESTKGLPTVKLLCADGHKGTRRYSADEFDFIVGYDLFTDTAYVYSAAEVAHLRTFVSIGNDAAECWDKLRD